MQCMPLKRNCPWKDTELTMDESKPSWKVNLTSRTLRTTVSSHTARSDRTERSPMRPGARSGAASASRRPWQRTLFLQPLEDRQGLPSGRVNAAAAALGDDAGDVLVEAAAGDVHGALVAALAVQLNEAVDVEGRRGEQRQPGGLRRVPRRRVVQ